MRYIVVWTEGGDDLSSETFFSEPEAREFLNDSEHKAFLIVASVDFLRVEDHT